MKNALLRRRLDDFGDLLARAWQHKKRMSPQITTPFIDELYDVGAARSGALGGKVTGAGGGGYMLLYCRFTASTTVAEALIADGCHGRPSSTSTHAGLATWSVDG